MTSVKEKIGLESPIMVPLIIAMANLMQTLDATILNTSIPLMAESLHEAPLRLHLMITVYMLSLAGFLPLSTWLSDRFGAKQILRTAIIVFALGSALCGFSTNLVELVLFRVIQGFGAAMLTPVGRSILVRSVSKTELVKALALMTMPSMIGPLIGPALGGLISTYWSWHWIFWINVPLGTLAFFMVGIFVPDVQGDTGRRFDTRGFILSSIGLGSLIFGVDTVSTKAVPEPFGAIALTTGIILLLGYAWHAPRIEHPILDLRLFKVKSLRFSIIGGACFRGALGAIPFLLPLMLQEGFGYSAIQSGLTTLFAAVGSLSSRGFTAKVLRRWGYRRVIITAVAGSSVFMLTYSLFAPTTPFFAIAGALILGGVFRSTGFSSINSLAFADIENSQAAQATSFSFMVQRISEASGVAVAAFTLHFLSGGAAKLPPSAFSETFVVVGILCALSLLWFIRLDRNAGSQLSGKIHRRSPQPAAATQS
jgi:EmrB/QacA subfamily drug resistance transporter